MPEQQPQDVQDQFEAYIHRGLSFDWLFHDETEGGNVVYATLRLSKPSLFFSSFKSKAFLSLFSHSTQTLLVTLATLTNSCNG